MPDKLQNKSMAKARNLKAARQTKADESNLPASEGNDTKEIMQLTLGEIRQSSAGMLEGRESTNAQDSLKCCPKDVHHASGEGGMKSPNALSPIAQIPETDVSLISPCARECEALK